MFELQNSKLIQLLKTFSLKELKEFERLLTTSASGKSKNYIALVKILTKTFLKAGTGNLSNEKIYKKLYPGKKYSEQTLKNLLTALTKLCEEFLVGNYLRRNPFIKKTFLLEELLDRKADNIFKREIRQAKSDLNKSPIGYSHFQHKTLIEDLEKGYDIVMNRQQMNFENILNMGNYLVIDFIIKLSLIASEMKRNSVNFNFSFEDSHVNKFLKNINLNDWILSLKAEKAEDIEIPEMFLCTLRMSLNDDDKSFERFLYLLNKHYNLFSHTIKCNFYIELMGYCGKRMIKDSKFYRIAFDLNKDMLDKKVYSYDKKYMTIILFRNIFVNAIALGEIEWTESYVKKYINTLEPGQSQNMFHFCQSTIYFQKKKYEEALIELNKVKYELFTFKFDVKNLHIKIYYELNYFEEILNIVDSYKHFLTKNKNVSEFFKTGNLNFVNIIKEIVLTRVNNKKENFNVLKEKIENTESINSKAWLLEKINEIR